MMVGGNHIGGVTSINLASNSQKKVQTADDILKQIESTLPSLGEQKYKQEELSSRILGRISQHEAAFGDSALPRQRLPKVDPGMLDRYQAARRNVLVLGAIQQANKSTQKAKSAAGSAWPGANGGSSHAAGSLADGDYDGGSAAATCLDSAFSSFNGSRMRSGRDSNLSTEPSGVLGAEQSQLSVASSVARELRHQSSGRSAGSSYTSGSAAAGRRLRQEHSFLSIASGQTGLTSYSGMTSHRSNRKTPRRKPKPPKPKPGRVAVAMAKFGAEEDWMSKTLLKHYLASVIQARWRGYVLRKRWANDKEQVVQEEKAKQQQEQLHLQYLQDMQQKLLARQQKQLAQAAVDAAASSSAEGAAGESADGTAAAAGGSLQASVSGAGTMPLVASSSRDARSGLSHAGGAGTHRSRNWPPSKFGGASDVHFGLPGESDSDSGWSDVEVEDVACIKFRAVTPPWQKFGEHQHMSKQLKQRAAAAAAAAMGMALPERGFQAGELGGMLGVLWNDSSADSTARLQELRHRRICRKPQPITLSEPAAAAAAATGLLGSPGPAAAAAASAGPAASTVNDDSIPLPAQAVEQLLLQRYYAKYNRLGLPEKMPGRTKWIKKQHETAAATATLSALNTSPAAVAAASTAMVMDRSAVQGQQFTHDSIASDNNVSTALPA